MKVFNLAIGLTTTVVLLMSCSEEKFSYNDGRTPLDDISEVPLADDEQLTLYDSLLAYIPAGFKLGCGVDMVDGYMNQAEHKRLVDQNFNAVTVGYHMKHGAMVGSTGAISYTSVDNFFKAIPKDMDVYGHTLVWHQNQNAVYLNDLISPTIKPSDDVNADNILTNGGFEVGLTPWETPFYETQFSITDDADYVASGSNALKVELPDGVKDYTIRLNSQKFEIQQGHFYEISFYIRSNSVGTATIVFNNGKLGNQYPYVNGHISGSDGKGRFITSLSWKHCRFNAETVYGEKMMQAIETDSVNFTLLLGVDNATYYIDHFKITDLGVTDSVAVVTQDVEEKTEAQQKTVIDDALKGWITSMVTHYSANEVGATGSKHRVLAWDVVNEAIVENGTLRSSANTTVSEGATDYFFWLDLLGEDYAAKAIQYARAAAPEQNLILFINDYNLETNNAKLDGLINFVNYTESKGQKVDGIGTQTHASIRDTSGIAALKTSVDNMFTKLAATGKLIKISELDIQVGSTTPSADLLKRQSDMYRYIIDSYMKHVPKEQQYGITLWGLGDGQNGSGWLPDDAPCIWDNSYKRKPAYKGTADGLAGREVGVDWTYGDFAK
jgi:GH35 family endo-1,4-beta-xylanase